MMRHDPTSRLVGAAEGRARWLAGRAGGPLAVLGLLLLALGAAFAEPVPPTPDRPGSEVDLEPLTPPDLEHLEASVATQLREAWSLLEAIQGRAGVAPGELAEAFGNTGRLYHAYDLTESAAICYTNAERLAPDDFRWAYLGAYVAQDVGLLERAIQGFERALELAPGNLPTLVRLGEAYLADGRLEEARERFGRALEVDPASAATLAALGQVALSEKQYQVAVDHLQAALAAVPAANRLHHPLGLAYRGLGDMAQARHHLSQRGGVGVQPPDPLIDALAELKVGERVFLLRGQLAFRNGYYDAAVEAFRAALKAEPDSVRARVNLGSALAEGGQRDAAIAIYQEVLELVPDNKTAHFNLGVLLQQAGDPKRSAEALTAAVRLDPKDAEARLQLTQVLARLDRWDEALVHALEVKELDPAHEGARVLIAQVLMRLGRQAAALESLEEAHDLMPEAGTIAVVLAKMLAAGSDLSLRDGPRALDLAQRIYQAIPNVQHAELVAVALAETGSCDAAVQWQRKALEAAQKAAANDLVRGLQATLEKLEQRPCRLPGQTVGSDGAGSNRG